MNPFCTSIPDIGPNTLNAVIAGLGALVAILARPRHAPVVIPPNGDTVPGQILTPGPPSISPKG